MRIARPRLFAWSLAVAAVVIVGFTLMLRTEPSGAENELDAVLDDAQTVVTFPNDGLANERVEGDPFPSVVLLDREGNEVTSSELIGEPLVVNLWFSTCAPCAKELPAFAEVDAEVDDVRFIGVNTLDSVEVMERFARDRGVEYPLFRDQNAELVDGIGAVAFPITLFVTSDGTIVDQVGALTADELRSGIENLRAMESMR